MTQQVCRDCNRLISLALVFATTYDISNHVLWFSKSDMNGYSVQAAYVTTGQLGTQVQTSTLLESLQFY